MNWVQFCIVMGYASWALAGMKVWSDWFEVALTLAGFVWLIAAVIVALCGGGA
jgi:hypothetical protein